MSLRIRDAHTGDAGAITRVHERSRAAAYRGLVDEETLHEMDVDERERRWTYWLGNPAVVTLVAEDDGGIVGFATLRATEDEDLDSSVFAEMPTLYVHPGRWRCGLGSRLCRTTCERAVAMGFRVLTLWVLELNRDARRFYESFGFREDGATKVDDGPTPTQLMARRYRLDLAEVVPPGPPGPAVP